jgi:hypothetical protein
MTKSTPATNWPSKPPAAAVEDLLRFGRGGIADLLADGEGRRGAGAGDDDAIGGDGFDGPRAGRWRPGAEDEDVIRDNGRGFELEAPGVRERVAEGVGGGERGGDGVSIRAERHRAGVVGESIASEGEAGCPEGHRTGCADGEADAGGIDAGRVTQADGESGEAPDGETIDRRELLDDDGRLFVDGHDAEETARAEIEGVLLREPDGGGRIAADMRPGQEIGGLEEVVADAGLGLPDEALGGRGRDRLDEEGDGLCAGRWGASSSRATAARRVHVGEWVFMADAAYSGLCGG